MPVLIAVASRPLLMSQVSRVLAARGDAVQVSPPDNGDRDKGARVVAVRAPLSGG